MNSLAARLVAHRGQIADYPENSLEALNAAIACGALFLEVDVQLSADHIPILSHDATLERTGGKDIDVRKKSFAELLAFQVGESLRLGDHFPEVFIPSLQQAIALLEACPEVQIFIELKQESFDEFGIETFVDKILEIIKPLAGQVIAISYNREALTYLRQLSRIRIGWIIAKLDESELRKASTLNPEFMFINHEACGNSDYDFAKDVWDWVLYETSDPDIAKALFKRGADYVESNDISKLLPYFQRQ